MLASCHYLAILAFSFMKYRRLLASHRLAAQERCHIGVPRHGHSITAVYADADIRDADHHQAPSVMAFAQSARTARAGRSTDDSFPARSGAASWGQNVPVFGGHMGQYLVRHAPDEGMRQ